MAAISELELGMWVCYGNRSHYYTENEFAGVWQSLCNKNLYRDTKPLVGQLLFEPKCKKCQAKILSQNRN